MSNVIISESNAMLMNAQKRLIWNSFSFQTELPALLVLGLENKQQPWHFFVKSNTSQVFVLSSGVFQPATTWSKCQYVFTMFTLLLLLSCEVRPLRIRQVRYAIETETGVLHSMPKKLFVNALVNINILIKYDLPIKIYQKSTCPIWITTGCVIIEL